MQRGSLNVPHSQGDSEGGVPPTLPPLKVMRHGPPVASASECAAKRRTLAVPSGSVWLVLS